MVDGAVAARIGLVGRLAELITSCPPPAAPALRIAIDGPDASGKTTLAGELGAAVAARGRPVAHVSADGFHRPGAERRRRGDLSPEGYYLDAFDLAALRGELLDPLGPGGDGRFRRTVFDLRADRSLPADVDEETAAAGLVLLVDGVFLLRPELRDAWDLAIVLDVRPEESLRRAVVRDAAIFGSEAEVRRRYLARYLPAQERYRREARVHERADVLLGNDDPARPVVRRWPRS